MKGVKFNLKDGSKFAIRDSNGRTREIFPSDLLFSSIICNVDLMYGKETADDVVKYFIDENLKISSMMIGLDFINKNTDTVESSIYFVPKPEAMIQKELDSKRDKLHNVLRHKQAKRVRMISINALQKLGRSWIEDEKRFDYSLSDLIPIGKGFVCTEDEIGSLGILEKLHSVSFSHITDRSRIQINRDTNYSENLYYYEEKVFRYAETESYTIKPFMYFLYDGVMPKEIEVAVNLMVDEGLGGNRSTGSGTFSYNEFIEVDTPKSNSSAPFMSISTYIPLKEEVESLIGYKLEKRDGYMYYRGGQPYRKKSMNIIKEGAIVSKEVKGNIANVTPDLLEGKRLAYIYGKALLLTLGGDKVE